MPSFLIVHSQPPGGRADLFAQPPTIDVSGLGARLDWGDVTFEVPPGDHRVTISVSPVAGGREGAVVTVRVLPDTGTRISFAPPAAPGQPSSLRVDGQWPADAAMAYYATRDRRELAPLAQQQQPREAQAAPWGGPQASQSAFAPEPQAAQRPAPEAYRPVASPFAPPAAARPSAQQPGPPPAAPSPTVPPVGPTIGSTGSVPIVQPPSSAPSFGQVQGAVVEPGAQHPQAPAAPTVAPGPAWGHQQRSPQHQVPPPSAASPHGMQQVAPPRAGSPAAVPPAVAPPAFGPGAPQQHPQHAGPQPPAFGHQPIVRRDVYGRDRVDGDRSAPAIPTPRQFEDFARHERERVEAEAVAASRQQQGWYPDPYGRSDVRWHDGERWTASVLRQGRRDHDPV